MRLMRQKVVLSKYCSSKVLEMDLLTICEEDSQVFKGHDQDWGDQQDYQIGLDLEMFFIRDIDDLLLAIKGIVTLFTLRRERDLCL